MGFGNRQLLDHSHSFGQERRRDGERRTIIVIILTSIMMVVEIAAGFLFGSMALLADGLHMASHAVALGINAFAYVYARRHAHDPRFSFGTGKVNALGGLIGAILLAVFALTMAWESVGRIVSPIQIAFNQAIFVAVLGLLVNGVSVIVLGVRHTHSSDQLKASHASHHRQDHNLRSAYLHVLADALTSLLAIFALLTGKYFGLVWMDPLMGIVGATLVARWSIGLLVSTSGVLLDRQGSEEVQERIRGSIEADGKSRIVDLHFWSVGPGIYGLIVSVATNEPKSQEYYKGLIPRDLGIVHATVEVNRE